MRMWTNRSTGSESFQPKGYLSGPRWNTIDGHLCPGIGSNPNSWCLVLGDPAIHTNERPQNESAQISIVNSRHVDRDCGLHPPLYLLGSDRRHTGRVVPDTNTPSNRDSQTRLRGSAIDGNAAVQQGVRETAFRTRLLDHRAWLDHAGVVAAGGAGGGGGGTGLCCGCD